MKTILPFVLLAELILFVIPASGQSYYPAGLGNANLVLWLTASDPTTLKNAANTQATNGQLVKTWTDKSGSGANATQGTNANRPVYQTNQLNGFGGVQFQTTSAYMTGNSGAYQTMVAVRSMPGTGHYQTLFSSPANTDFSIRGGGAGTGYTDLPNANDWPFGTGATPTQWINGVQSLNGSSTNHILVSAAAGPTNKTYSISNYNPTAAWGGRGMDGNDPVYELLGYNTTLSNTQRILLENYEASEWGLTGLLPTSGYTVFTPPTPSTYNQNLVGIGYTSGADNFLANPAGSTDGLGFSSTTGATGFLQTAGYIMAAHNGQASTITTNPGIPDITSTSNIKIWNRSWYLQLSDGNTAGQVTVNFNFSDYDGTSPNAAYAYSIIYNATDGTFMTGTNQFVTTVSTTVSGNIVSFNVNAANLSNGYYSIIYSTRPLILPITLTGFTAEKEQASSLLEWSAAAKTGIGLFTIERSENGIDFDSIGSVAALANESVSAGYAFTDNRPWAGANYYRLKMTDSQGEVTYSYIVTVDFDTAAAVTVVPTIYPNPVADVLHINLNSTSAAPTIISLFNMMGQRIISQDGSSSSEAVDIPVNQLSPGLYLVEIITGGARYTRKIIKE